MARYVVLSFDDNEEAEQFCTDMEMSALASLHRDAAGDDPTTYDGGEVLGLFAQPTKFCDPTDGHLGRGKIAKAFARGTRYGWWVCKACKKPTKAWGTFVPAVIGSAVNLLSTYKEDAEPSKDDPDASKRNETHIVPIIGTHSGVSLHG